MARWDIVIPHWGEGHLAEVALDCLRSLADAGGDFRLILVDNGSADRQALEPQLRRMNHVVIRNNENLGFIKATNQGLQFSDARYVVMLNNDTIVPSAYYMDNEFFPGRWLEVLEAPLREMPDAGLSGPLTDAAESWQGRWAARNGGGLYMLPAGRMLAFFCTMVRRDVLESVGYLDESYGVGFGDDDEYCRRAETAGYKLALCQDLKVKHRHRTSFKTRYTAEQIEQMQRDAMRRFRLTAGDRNGGQQSQGRD